MLENLRVGTRMAIACGAVVLLFALTLIWVGNSLSSLKQYVRTINDKSLPFVMVADEMDISRSDVQQFLTDVSATHDRDGYKEAEDSAKRFLGGVEKFKQLYRQENDAENLKQMESIEADFSRFYTSGKVMAEAYIIDGMDTGNLLMKGSDGVSGFDKESEAILEALSKFRNQQVAEADKITTSAINAAESTMDMMIVGCLISAIIASILGVWTVRSILRQLGGEPIYAAEIMSKIAGGDLSVEVQTKVSDSQSMLFSLRTMVGKLNGVVSEVRNTTDSISTAAKEIAAGNNDLSHRTEQQASNLEETASSMEELTSTVKQNAENARQGNQLAVSASNIAVKGGQAVNDVVQTMVSISTSSKKIGDIISVIEGIAFQTNILALNAAVEAARAGEQGRGFAVVAGEVRNLAQRSASAAKEIKILIDDSVGKVEVGSKQVDQAGATMNEIVQAVKRVTDIMSEISAASDEQRAGIEEVNHAIIQVDDMTQQNAALVEQAAAAAESMQGQAGTLMGAVKQFKLAEDEGGSDTTARYVAKPSAKHHIQSHQTPVEVARPRKDHRLVEAKEDKDEEWKEF